MALPPKKPAAAPQMPPGVMLGLLAIGMLSLINFVVAFMALGRSTQAVNTTNTIAEQKVNPADTEALIRVKQLEVQMQQWDHTAKELKSRQFKLDQTVDSFTVVVDQVRAKQEEGQPPH